MKSVGSLFLFQAADWGMSWSLRTCAAAWVFEVTRNFLVYDDRVLGGWLSEYTWMTPLV